MGCTSSAGSKDDLTQRNVGKLKNKHHHKDVNKLDVDELTEADIQHKKEELLQRQEQERDYQENIYAEQSSLRSNAMLMIERKDSCESLMDLLDDTELEEIRRNEDSFTLQKQMKVKYAKEAFNNMQKWVVSPHSYLLSRKN